MILVDWSLYHDNGHFNFFCFFVFLVFPIRWFRSLILFFFFSFLCVEDAITRLLCLSNSLPQSLQFFSFLFQPNILPSEIILIHSSHYPKVRDSKPAHTFTFDFFVKRDVHLYTCLLSERVQYFQKKNKKWSHPYLPSFKITKNMIPSPAFRKKIVQPRHSPNNKTSPKHSSPLSAYFPSKKCYSQHSEIFFCSATAFPKQENITKTISTVSVLPSKTLCRNLNKRKMEILTVFYNSGEWNKYA